MGLVPVCSFFLDTNYSNQHGLKIDAKTISRQGARHAKKKEMILDADKRRLKQI
jgi:hypothetical protein